MSITGEEEAIYARSFKQSDFYRNVFVPYLDERKKSIHSKLDEYILRDATKTVTSMLSGRRREIADMEEWLETLFTRLTETKGR